MSGTKHDKDKLRLELVPVEATEAIARAMTYGAKKYGDWNWAEGIAHARLFGAALRHMWAYFRGEDIDKESGNHHLDHALASLAMLRASVANNLGKDDRPKYMHGNIKWEVEPIKDTKKSTIYYEDGTCSDKLCGCHLIMNTYTSNGVQK